MLFQLKQQETLWNRSPTLPSRCGLGRLVVADLGQHEPSTQKQHGQPAPSLNFGILAEVTRVRSALSTIASRLMIDKYQIRGYDPAPPRLHRATLTWCSIGHITHLPNQRLRALVAADIPRGYVFSLEGASDAYTI